MAELSVADLAQAKAAVGALLEGLGLSAYLFAVEPREGAWAVIVECATDSGWQRSELQAGAELLGASLRDPAARAALLDQWRAHLAACKTD
ncbi:hypothetical protein [Sulfuricella sp.]|jgi:hypothetical protein|uniref:hypothetical protein n=1 Tax=Sulfuricella sp. TaxID=2099377 RepID=UPI002CA63CA4|nr:hypothetical protein [Sulfuricella sp.]HUX63304.1 hypothetical protein [Sulfuricella sp.]